MKLIITRIEPRIVTCEIEDTGSLLDITRRCLTEDIQLEDVIEIDFSKQTENNIK